jgi:structural hemagglutinin/hemolysin toxin protein RtxA
MYKICFYVPENYADVVKNAMFAAGAGVNGKYTHLSWQTLGEGQSLAQPEDIDNLEKQVELKVEMVCQDAAIAEVIQALKTAHPYEQASYQVWELKNF